MTKWRLPKAFKNAQQPTLPGLFPQPRIRRLATPREQALELARTRLTVVILMFTVAWIALGGRLSYLTLHNNTPETQTTETAASDEPTRRADITDRNGTILATSLPTTSLCADSKAITNPTEAARQLMTALPDLNAQRLNEDLRGGKHCAMIKRHLTPKQSYEVNKLGIAGLEFLPDERRVYPASNITAHVVGFTDIDNDGIAGIEKSMAERLNGNPEPLALSLDLRVQSILHQELADAMGEYHAEAAAGLVMDATTGEILSMVSLPDFDPDHPGSATDEQRFNRDTLGVYEMGSTFKIFNTALALDSGLIHITDTFDTAHPLEIGHHKIRDFEKENRSLNVAEVFTHSSNIGSARMAQIFGGVRQRTFFEKLGLTEKLQLELPEVGAPLLPPAKDWSEATTLTAAFGHGVAVNAVQLAGAVATIANDGIPVHPTLLKKTAPTEQTESPVISPRTSALIRSLMRLVVTNGTAKKADVDGYMIGGKTGTADKLVNGHYAEHARLSSFIGLFPINAPKYLVFALLDNPKGNAQTAGFATGGWVSAPIVNRTVSQIAPLLGMPPLSKEVVATTERQILKPLGSQMIDGVSVAEMGTMTTAEIKHDR